MELGVINRRRFLGVVGRFGSDFEGERGNAAKLATDILKASGLTWDDVIRLPDNSPPFPQPEARTPGNGRDLVRDLIEIIGDLPTGRANFVRGCHAQKSSLSDKQVAALQDAWERHFGQQVRA